MKISCTTVSDKILAQDSRLPLILLGIGYMVAVSGYLIGGYMLPIVVFIIMGGLQMLGSIKDNGW